MGSTGYPVPMEIRAKPFLKEIKPSSLVRDPSGKITRQFPEARERPQAWIVSSRLFELGIYNLRTIYLTIKALNRAALTIQSAWGSILISKVTSSRDG
jgi:hypothetical protein